MSRKAVDKSSNMLDDASILPDASEPSITAHIAQRVRHLRARSGLSLDSLAKNCGISRSMISLIERGESSPTAVLLEKLASGLGVPLPTLFAAQQPSASPVARAVDQPVWRDPSSGYVRRSVSPSGVSSHIQIVEVVFPAKARVAYESGLREPLTHQQIWVLDGAIDITVGPDRHQLSEGDCLAMLLDLPVMFHNPHMADARYAVVVVAAPFLPISKI